MKWSIWIEPNKIIEEEYPDGWSHDEVFQAASARWANKVTTVNPAPVGGSSSQDNTNSSSGGSSIGLGGLIILAGLVGLISMCGSEDNDTYEPETTIQQQQVQPRSTVTWTPYAPPALDVKVPFFVEDSVQEEAIDDLGQDWDN